MRLIDAKDLEIKMMESAENDICDDCAYEFVNLINDAQTVDAVPVVHGQWEQSGFSEVRDKWTTYKCSVCGTSNGRKFNDKYCRNCGAKMDEKDGDNDA